MTWLRGQSAVVIQTSFQKNDFFKLPSEVITRLDSKVVQIDCNKDNVLVSTYARSYLCFTSKHQFKHIGTKPRCVHQKLFSFQVESGNLVPLFFIFSRYFLSCLRFVADSCLENPHHVCRCIRELHVQFRSNIELKIFCVALIH